MCYANYVSGKVPEITNERDIKMANGPLIVKVPHPFRRVEAEYVHTGQGKDYFTIAVDGHLTHNYVEIPAGTRPLHDAVVEAYKAKFPVTTEQA